MQKLRNLGLPKGVLITFFSLVFLFVATVAYGALTFSSTSVVSDSTLTLNGAAASAITIGNTAQTAAISIGDTASTTVTEISIGGGDGIKSAINIGDGAGANVITIGGASTGTTVGGTLAVNGIATMGNAVADGVILKGRVSTGSSAGAALTLDSTYTYAEGQELRYDVTDWTGVGTTFNGTYLRAQNSSASTSKNVRGMELYGVANNVNTGSVWGLLSYGYVKGSTDKTVGPVYGVQTELSFDEISGTNTITTEATPLLAKITGGVVDTYTKIQGMIVRAGDMGGQNRTYGNAILVEDDSNLAGTITWTRGLKLSAPSTADIELQNGETIANGVDDVVAITSPSTTFSGDITVTGSDVSVGAAGVKLTGDTDGAITLLGMGDGFDEDLKLNLDDTENTGVFTSSTGLVTLNFSSIALQESGIAVLNNDEIDASSELAAIMDDEVGTGALVFASLADGQLVSFASVSVTSATEGLILPQHATDCSASGTAEGQVCWEADANTLYIGTDGGVSAITPGTASANTWTNVQTWQDNLIGTFAGDEDFVITAASASTNDVLSLIVTSTGAADAASIALTIDDTAAANVVDTIAALNIAVTSAATGEADVLAGLNIANLASADGTVLERAIVVGTGWDQDLRFADTSVQIVIADGGTFTFENATGTDFFTAAAGTITVTGSIVPEAAGTRNLGSATAEMASIFIGDGSAADISTTGIQLGLDQDAILAYDENTSDRVELVGTNADLWIEDVLSLGKQTLAVTDDGVANDTLTVTASYVELDMDGTGNEGAPNVVMDETGAKEGDLLIIVRIDANAGDVTINESDGVNEQAGNLTLNTAQRDSVMYIYDGGTWVQLAASDNG